jgi:hypothetical protein
LSAAAIHLRAAPAEAAPGAVDDRVLAGDGTDRDADRYVFTANARRPSAPKWPPVYKTAQTATSFNPVKDSPPAHGARRQLRAVGAILHWFA